MAKRPPIMLGSKHLHECRIDEIVDIASHPLRNRFDLGPCADYIRNCEMVRAFKGASERTTSEIVAGFCASHSHWSENFNALRAGAGNGRVLQHSWRLLHADLQFETIGTGPRQRAIRIYNSGASQAEHWKLWVRETKRRERGRLRKLEKLRSQIQENLARICRVAPEYDLTKRLTLARFAVGDIKSIGACRQFILDELDSTSDGDVRLVHDTLDMLTWRLETEASKQRREAPAPAEALAELDDFSL